MILQMRQTLGHRLPGGAIRRWSLRFESDELENRYQAARMRNTNHEIRIWGIWAIFIYLAHGSVEWFLIPEQLHMMLLVRLVITAPVFFGAWLLSYTKYFERYMQPAIVVCVFAATAGYLIMLAQVPEPLSRLYSYLLVIVLLFLHGHMGIRFIYGLLANGFLLAGYFVVTFGVNPVADFALLFQNSLFIMAFAIIILFMHHNHEILAHRNFRATLVLSREIGERLEAEQRILAAHEAAENANRSKSLFLANMSHELRTPLNAISGFADIMEKEMFGPLGDPHYKEYARDIHASGHHLLAIIDDILDLSRVEAGHSGFDGTESTIEDVVASCIPLVRRRAEEGEVSLYTNIERDLPRLVVDVRRVKQILINLLSNAVKFTEPGGRIEVFARMNGEDALEITVKDNGIGMRAEDIPKALEPFGQIDASLTRKYEGTGLGLTLVKQMTEAHGGSLHIDSQLGVGTAVTVRFPANRVVKPAAKAPTATKGSETKPV